MDILLLLLLRSTVSLLVLCGILSLHLATTTSAFQVVNISPFQQQYNTLSTTSTTTSTSSKLLMSNNFIDINEYTAGMNRDINTFDEWSTNCGVQRSDGFQIIESETNTGDIDYSIITTEPIPAESPVLYVSNEMIFTSEQIRSELVSQDYGIEDAEQLLEKLGVPPSYFPQYYLFLKVLIEYQNGSDSPWYPWLNSLPRKFSNGSSMTPYCYECLPPLVSKLSMNERIKFINFFKSLQKISSNLLSDDIKNNQELSKWAYNIVYTRCFGNTLVPMADMFNHASIEVNIEIRMDENNNCYVYSLRDIAPNEPLCLSYGDPTNPSHLFATYGFLDESSPATFCKIMNIKPTPELQNIGLDYTRMLFFKDTGDITEEVWDVLLYQILVLRNEINVKNEFYNAHMNGDSDTKNDIHQRYFQYTSMTLKDHVDTFLRQLDDLSAKALTKNVNEHPRIPIILKHNAFVKETFLKVQDKINSMVEQYV